MPFQPPSTAWTPGPAVTDLTGEPLPPDADFNVPPPDDVGNIIAAWTPARTDKLPKPAWTKWLTLIAVPLAVYLIGSAIVDFAQPTPIGRENLLPLVVIVTLVTIGLTAWLVFRRPDKYIWYVGADGVARVFNRRPLKPGLTLRFAEADSLRTGQVKQYYNGVYMGTRYHYTWTSPDGRTLLKLNGSYKNSKKAHGTNNPYRFCVSSEVIWNGHYRQRAANELGTTGAITFPVNRKDYIRVTPDSLQFFMKGEEVAITKDEIAGISLSSGTFTVRHKDAKWYKRGGKYSFNYAAMSNAQVFLFCLEKLLGYKFD